jgi:hypothetical protein
MWKNGWTYRSGSHHGWRLKYLSGHQLLGEVIGLQKTRLYKAKIWKYRPCKPQTARKGNKKCWGGCPGPSRTTWYSDGPEVHIHSLEHLENSIKLPQMLGRGYEMGIPAECIEELGGFWSDSTEWPWLGRGGLSKEDKGTAACQEALNCRPVLDQAREATTAKTQLKILKKGVEQLAEGQVRERSKEELINMSDDVQYNKGWFHSQIRKD